MPRKRYSVVVKVDGVTMASAVRIADAAKEAALGTGARGTYIVLPTEELRTTDGQRLLEEAAEAARRK